MFFVLSKLLYFLTTPVVWIILLFAYSFVSKRPIRKRRALITAFVMLLFFTNSFILDEFMRKWEVQAIHRESIVEPYDVGIVLSGMLTYDESLDRIDFHGGVDRLLQTVDLYKSKKIKKIFLSGGSGSLLDDYQEAELLEKFLVKIGIPARDIMYEIESKNTHENAYYSKQYLDEKLPDGHFLLITSAYHMRRSLKCFEKVGLNVDPYTANRRSGPRKFVFDHMFIPDSSALSGWNSLSHEIVGYMAYWISGYI